MTEFSAQQARFLPHRALCEHDPLSFCDYVRVSAQAFASPRRRSQAKRADSQRAGGLFWGLGVAALSSCVQPGTEPWGPRDSPLPGGVLVLLRGRYRTYFFKKVAVDNFLLDELCLKFFLSLYFMIINTSVHAYYYIQLVVNLKLI